MLYGYSLQSLGHDRVHHVHGTGHSLHQRGHWLKGQRSIEVSAVLSSSVIFLSDGARRMSRMTKRLNNQRQELSYYCGETYSEHDEVGSGVPT